MPRKKLGEILVEAGVIAESQLGAALNEQRKWGGTLGRVLVDMRIIGEDVLVSALSRQLGLPAVQLEGRAVDGRVLELVPADLCRQHVLFPFAVEGKFLDVAMSDPTNLGIIDELRIRTRLNVRNWLAGPRAIEAAIDRWYRADGAGKTSGGDAGPPGGVYAFRPGSFVAEAAADLAGATGAQGGAPTLPSGDISLGLGAAGRDLEIAALQARVQTLEALVQRDEDVLRKLMALLIEKGICTREEILERIR